MLRPQKAVQIGAGRFSHDYHAPTLRRLATAPSPRISLEAVCDLDPARAELFCREFGYARAYTDFRKMIRELRPDLIYVMVQPVATAGVLENVLPVGVPTFVEKPPGVTIAESERLAMLAENYGTLSYVGFNRRRMPGLEHLKAWAASGRPLRYVSAEMLRNRRLESDFAIGTAIHPLDFLRYLCGDVSRLSVADLPHSQAGARDYFISLEFETGTVGEIRVLVDCGLRRERYMAQTSNAAMEVTLGAGYSSLFCEAGERAYRDDQLVLDLSGSTDPLTAGGFMGEHEAFLDFVACGCLPDCCLQNASQSLRLAAAVEARHRGPMDQFSASPQSLRGGRRAE